MRTVDDAMRPNESSNPVEAIELATGEERVKGLAQRFNLAAKRTAGEILEMAVIIEQAHDELGEKYLAAFYNQIRIAKDGSTAAKLRKIAQQKTRLETHVDLLPSNWTTLYELATLEPAEFGDLIRKEVLHPLVTWKEIQARFVRPENLPMEKVPRLVIDIGKITENSRRKDFATKLNELLKEFFVVPGDKLKATLHAFINDGVRNE